MLAPAAFSPHEERRCNSGGPMSRTRTQRLHATVLGAGSQRGGCAHVQNVGIDFGSSDPLESALAVLALAGISDAEELRGLCVVPDEPCICRAWSDPQPLPLASAPRDDLLAQLLLLGLCTPHCFDPRRPVLLTRASLTRRLQLFSGRGFYA